MTQNQIIQSISFKERNLNVQIIFLFVIMYRKYLMSKIQYKCQIICMYVIQMNLKLFNGKEKNKNTKQTVKTQT